MIGSRDKQSEGDTKMTRKTYNNVIKAGKMIQKKGYSKKESWELAINFFDQIEMQKAVYGIRQHIEPMIERIVTADEYYSSEYQKR